MQVLKSIDDRRSRIKATVLVILAALTVVFALFVNKPGHVTLDESVYHLMARDFARTGGWNVYTGYEDIASPEFSYPVTQDYGGRLASQYPSLYSVIAYPFYLAAGYHGLFFLNLLAFFAVLWICYRTAATLFDDRALSLNACLIFMLATYAWEYSQAVWPHALSTLFVAGAAYLAVLGFKARRRRDSLLLAALAGLVIGIGCGVRVDVVLVAPALLALFLFTVPWRPMQALAIGLGMVPGLLMVAMTNLAKFGIFSPVTYGPVASGMAANPTSYLALGLLVGAAAVFLWGLTRSRSRAWLLRNRRLATAGIFGAVAIALLIPDVWQILGRLANGGYQLVVDLRIRDLSHIEGAQTRGPGGGLIYMGALKKSLLQSCPYLIVIVLSLIALVKVRRDSMSLSFLFLVPAAFVGFYSFFAWHGGMSLNLRYFIPILPFTSILTAYAWREMTDGVTGMSRTVAYASTLAVFAMFIGMVVVPLPLLPIETLEIVVLTLPLVAALTLLILLTLRWSIFPVVRVNGARMAAFLAVLCFSWSGFVAFTHDYPRSWVRRHFGASVSRDIGGQIPADAVVFSNLRTALSGLYERETVRLVEPYQDSFKDFRPILEFYLDREQPVYGLFLSETWEDIRGVGLLDGFDLVPISDVRGRSFARIRRTTGAASENRQSAPGVAAGRKRPDPVAHR